MRTTATPSRSRARQSASRLRTNAGKDGALRIRNILVPIDFSAASLEAIEWALPLIKQFGAELHLVHVFEPDYPLASMAAMPLIVPELEVGKRVQRHLKDVAKKYSVQLRPENIHAVKGRPFEEICGLARDREIDLIITSTRGNTGLKHLVLGSTAERVVRYSPCPVLVGHGVDRKKKTGRNETPRSAIRFKKILVPIDFSDCSMKGLVYAKALAKQFGATLVLLHSVHVQYYVTSDEYSRYDFPLLMQQAEKAARDGMRDLVGKSDWDGSKVDLSLQIGHPGDQICTRARDHGADLIVTSTHGTTGFKHILLGRTAEYVVTTCPLPCLGRAQS